MTGLPSAHVLATLVDRLAKAAGLSDHDAERGAAAHRAMIMLREAGLTWRQVIEASGRWVAEPEREFLSASGRKQAPSSKQQAVLHGIFLKVMPS